MKTLFKLRILQSVWTPQSPSRLFHKDNKRLVSQMVSHYESINRCEQELPEHFNFASDVLDKWSQLEKDGKRPATAAFWWINDKGDEVKWSFEELGFLSRKAANVLSDPCGLQRGDRVIVILPRIPEWWILNVACMRTGIVFIPGTSQLRAKDIFYRLQASKAKCIITNDTLAPAVDSVLPDCQFLKSKLIVSEGSKDGWLNFQELLKYWLNLTPSDIFWNTSDTGWVKSVWSSVFSPWSSGSCVFIHNLPQFEPATVANTLSRYPITTFCTASTAYCMLVQHGLTSYKFMSLRHCVTGGEPLNPEVMKQWKTQTGLDIYEGYGQTETVTICSNVKGMKIKPGSMGKASAPYDVQVVDDQGDILPRGEEGNIAIRIKPTRPFCLFSQYLDNPEKTASTEHGNFYITGDRGIMDEEGYFWFVGRSDDIINSSGYRIGPFEVESALIQHPAVAESAVASSPDPIRGEVVKAFVVLAPAFLSHDPEKLALELQEHVKKVTAPYKYPRKVEFVQELPKTVAGKIQRKVLRNKEWGRA
ncbi:acyl-coenzyme A synthetase ACSM4, mitochondrial-like isoform X2 [Malaclemys terrapin pileata]|uniref:acyl-coenzyme A synthetase ACSM4, mitochondrial-like isoform X2 n=1 Tax=Malaclemys terrapin pileata TaxID=2991368 RepID=UPI0023A8E308|nr:acyl-coenzyme A synthetase ACSM4, mitochondrial-like isoform X2 [Malaclemys terrapin pileata]